MLHSSESCFQDWGLWGESAVILHSSLQGLTASQISGYDVQVEDKATRE